MYPARGSAVGFCLSAFTLFCNLILALPSRAQTVETPQEANDRIRALAASSHAVPAPVDYVIGNGDLISVQVFDVPELTRELRVSQTGTIGIPLIPVRLHVAGLTEVQAERKIEEVLEANGIVSHAEVSVTVREKKSRPITVVGAVGHPTVYSAERQVTLIEVLAEAGGITPDASDHVIITRPERPTVDASEPPPITSEDAAPPRGEGTTPLALKPSGASESAPQVPPASTLMQSSAPEASDQQPAAPSPEPPPLPAAPANTITINLNQILETGDMSNNIVVLPGDVVTVPHAGIIYVLGAVARPGGYTVASDRAQLSTLKVLSLAGGLNKTAKGSHAVIVRKDSTGKQTETEVDLTKVMRFQTEDVQLRPSDILYVPTSHAKVAGVKAGEIALFTTTSVLLYRLIYQ
jgi:polysaccharide export outer membrane protein